MVNCFSELGILIDNNKTVSWIKPGSVADLEERLTVGDKIITVSTSKSTPDLVHVLVLCFVVLCT